MNDLKKWFKERVQNDLSDLRDDNYNDDTQDLIEYLESVLDNIDVLDEVNHQMAIQELIENYIVKH